MKPIRLGLGSRLDARFRPTEFWGAEFLAHRVRLSCVGIKANKTILRSTFEGTYPEAEAFAVKHKLRFLGLHAAVSHLPFKVQSLGSGSEAGEEDITSIAEQLRPQGLPLSAFDAQTFIQGHEKHLVLAREEALRGVLEAIPASLSGLESLDASPIALLSSLDLANCRGWSAGLILEAEYCHVLFLQDGVLRATVKIFSGWEEAQARPEIFTKEIKKALLFHFGSRYPDAELASVMVWKDGTQDELSLALKTLGLTQAISIWSPTLKQVPETFRVATAMAQRGIQEDLNAMSFSVPYPHEVMQRRLWRRRAGTLAKTGFHILAGSTLGVFFLLIAAFALRWTVETKARTWSGELGKWDEYQKRKVSVESQLGEMQEMLAHRTQTYAAIQNISKCLPSEVWLESWEVESGSGTGAGSGPARRHGLIHRVSGLSLTEARIPEFLSNLENVKKLGVVKLKSTERIKGETVEQKTTIQANRKDLVRYFIGISE